MGLSLEMVQRSARGRNTLILPLNYRCNSRCRFCIIGTEIAARFDDTVPEVFDEVFSYNASVRRFSRLTISGRSPPCILRSSRWRAEPPQTAALMWCASRPMAAHETVFCGVGVGWGAGILRIHPRAHDGARRTHHPVESQLQMRQGVANLLEVGARVISNTVISADNGPHLQIAAFLVEQGFESRRCGAFSKSEKPRAGRPVVSLDTILAPLLGALEVFESAEPT